MSQIHPVLVIEDDRNLRIALVETLRLSNYPVLEAESAEDALKILNESRIGLIISDVQMPGMDGHQLLTEVKRSHPDIPFVLVTAYGDVKKAVAAIQSGAADYVMKPFEAEVLIEMVNRLALVNTDEGEMIIADERSQTLADLCRRVANTDVSVMISGESGSGKEVYSKYIHNNSQRSENPFFAINCAAIPESMLESVLFGYEKGAFTGAYIARPGKFEQANNGTLLLDEISEMDIGLQAKLLRVLQEKEVERLGGNKTIPLDVRIIATTNRDLKEEVLAGRFREDLFYRLNVFPLHLPPLRERVGDILPLANKFIEIHQGGSGIQLSDEAQTTLLAHDWRGNVRELENVIQRALILKNGNTICAQDIVIEELGDAIGATEPTQPTTLLEEHESNPLGSDLKSREKELIIDAVTTNRSRKEAAEKLGISPRTLRYKLAQFRKDGIAIPCFSETAQAS